MFSVSVEIEIEIHAKVYAQFEGDLELGNYDVE